MGYSPWGHEELDTTATSRLHDAFLVSTHLPSVIFQPHHANFSSYYHIFIFQEMISVLHCSFFNYLLFLFNVCAVL